MYEYTFSDVKKTINTPGFCNNMNEVKTNLISQTSDLIHARFMYPNGFCFETETYADKIIIRSNKKLIDNGDGTLSVLEE